MDTRTHYIPSFTRRSSSGLEQAVCGSYVEPAFCVVPTDPQEPTCWGCKMYLENLDVILPETAEELRTR
jgi:hypothetical protein